MAERRRTASLLDMNQSAVSGKEIADLDLVGPTVVGESLVEAERVYRLCGLAATRIPRRFQHQRSQASEIREGLYLSLKPSAVVEVDAESLGVRQHVEGTIKFGLHDRRVAQRERRAHRKGSRVRQGHRARDARQRVLLRLRHGLRDQYRKIRDRHEPIVPESRPAVRRYICSTRRYGDPCGEPIVKAEPLEAQLVD